MKKYIICIIIILISCFFINTKANFKYNVNYNAVNRHVERINTYSNSYDTVYNYILAEVSKYDVEVSKDNNSIIVKKFSKNTNAKTIGFITKYVVSNYNSLDNNNSIAVSSFIGAIQTYNNHNSNNNLIFIFTNDSLDTLDSNIDYIKNNKKLYKTIDYLFSFNTSGNSGELYLYNSSNDQNIINFYKSYVTSKSGFSDFELGHSNPNTNNFASFGIFNNTSSDLYGNISKFNDNSKNLFINTINELAAGAHEYNFSNSSSKVSYFNYFDSFISISNNVINGLAIISILMYICYLYKNKSNLNFKKIGKYLILNMSTLIIPIMTYIIAINEFAYFLDKFGINYLKELIFGSVLIIILISTFITNKISQNHYKINKKENIILTITSNILLVVINLVLFSQVISILILTLVLLTMILIFIDKIDFKILLLIFLIIILPIITHNLYFMYNILTIDEISIFTLVAITYSLILTPILSYRYK
ncbi:MAG: hypothetical protein ACK5NF_03560 [Bacilli bacterium]